MAVVVISIFCAGFVIPQILLIAFRKKLFDEPDERKIHRSLVPRLGGIAFKPVIFFSLFFVIGLNVAMGNGLMLENTLYALCPMLFGFCAMLILYLVGIADDLIGVRYRAKFVAQVLCAILIIVGGIWINDFHGLFFLKDIPSVIGYPLTVLMIVFIINSINLIDGIDGLASGLSAIATLVYAIVFYLLEDYIYAMLSFATLGVLMPFFYYNVFGDAEKRKKIFMGDTGSLTIGIVLTILSIHMAMFPLDKCLWQANPIIIAFIPLFIPCCDVIRVYLQRVHNGRNPFLPDKTHIHHKLLAIGMHQRIAMVTIVSCSFILVVANIFLSRIWNINVLILMDILLWVMLNLWLSVRVKSIKK